jgi:hypothetical protein
MCASKTSFGKWSAKERDAVWRKTDKAIKQGIYHHYLISYAIYAG